MILHGLVGSRYVDRHLLVKVLSKPGMTAECVDDLLTSRLVELLPSDLGDDFVAEAIPGEGWGSEER